MSNYITFPMELLDLGPNHVSKAMTNAMEYALYYYCDTNYGNKSALLEAASEYLGISFGNINRSFENGKIFYESIDSKAPKTSINTKMALQFQDETKTEFELITFIAFAALKSIIQQQGCTKISNEYLLSRMAGYPAKVKPENLPQWLSKYTTRHYLDKIKSELTTNWGLKLYGKNCRGYYVSFSMEEKNLIKHALKNSPAQRRLAAKIRSKQAYEAAIQEISVEAVTNSYANRTKAAHL